MLNFPQSEYQTRKRRQETGQRVVLQSHGWSHYCPGANMVHSQLSCLTKTDFPSHFPWSNTLQNWCHKLVFSSTVVVKDILLLSLELKSVSTLHAPHCLLLDVKWQNAYKGISPIPPVKGTMWLSSCKSCLWDTERKAWSCKQQGLGRPWKCQLAHK